MEKEMYLKVLIKEEGDVREIILPKSRDIKSVDVISLEDAEMAGAEKLHKALKYIECIRENKDWMDIRRRYFNGYFSIVDIINLFTPKEIIERVEKMKYHVPTQGDVYKSRHTNNNIVVLSFNEKTRETRYVARNYASCEKEDYVNEHYYFTGENIDVSALISKIG